MLVTYFLLVIGAIIETRDKLNHANDCLEASFPQ